MLNPEQATAAADALLASARAPTEPMVRCPVCGGDCTTKLVRSKLKAFSIIRCRSCGVALRLKHGRTVFAVGFFFLAACGLGFWLAAQSFKPPLLASAGVAVSASLASRRAYQRLALEPAP